MVFDKLRDRNRVPLECLPLDRDQLFWKQNEGVYISVTYTFGEKI